MRYAVTYRIDGGKCQTGFAVQTCDGAKVYATATGGEPIAGAVVVPFEQCPDEVFVVNPSGGGGNDCSCLPIETCNQSTQGDYVFEPIYYTGVTDGYMTRRMVVPLPTYTDMSVVGATPSVAFRLSTIDGADERAIFSYRVALASSDYDFDEGHINFKDWVSGVMPASNNYYYAENLRALTENDFNNPDLAVVIEVTGLAYQFGNDDGTAGVTFPVQGEIKKQQAMVVQPSNCDIERQSKLVAGIVSDIRSIMQDTVGSGAGNGTGGGHPAEPVGRKVSTIWFSSGINRRIRDARTTKSIRIQFLSAGTLTLPRTDNRGSYEILQVPAGFIYEADAGDADYLDLAGVRVDADAIATFTSTGLVETEVVPE